MPEYLVSSMLHSPLRALVAPWSTMSLNKLSPVWDEFHWVDNLILWARSCVHSFLNRRESSGSLEESQKHCIISTTTLESPMRIISSICLILPLFKRSLRKIISSIAADISAVKLLHVRGPKYSLLPRSTMVLPNLGK